MNILILFLLLPKKPKFLIVEADYHTNLVEAEALENITTTNILKFFKRNILARYWIPQVVVIDNGSHFIVWKLNKLLEELKVK